MIARNVLGDLNRFFPWFEIVDEFNVDERSSRWKVDLRELDNQYVLECELPGVNKDDIDISFEKQVLSVSVSKAQSNEQEKGKFKIKERSEFTQTRRFNLPDADVESINAVMKDGILAISINKKKGDSAKRVSIK